MLPCPPYFLDLDPFDPLISKTKNVLRGKRFSTVEYVKAVVDGYYRGLAESYFRDGIMALEQRWSKCIVLKENYVEK